jgi:hypothetical protein
VEISSGGQLDYDIVIAEISKLFFDAEIIKARLEAIKGKQGP